MWQPIRIKIQNLFSHKDTEYEFKRNQCVMIYGINETDADKDSNGGGKSTLMEGITLAISNQTNRDVGKDDFINEEENECFVEFELENNIGSVKNLIIRRWFHRKKSTKVELVENGKVNKEMTSVNECNARIYELIGLTREDLIHFFLIGQDTNYSFLTAGDADKKNIVSRLININFINKKIDILKALSKEKNTEKSELLQNVVSVQTRLEVIDEQIADLKDNYETDKRNRIQEIEELISNLETKKTSKNKELKTKNKELEEVNSFLEENEFDEENLSKLKKEAKTIDSSISELNVSKRRNNNKIKEYQATQEDAIQCPKCLHKFLLDNEILLEHIPAQIKHLQDLNSKIDKKVEKFNLDLEKNKKKQNDESEKQELIEEKEFKKRNLNRTIKDINEELELIDKKITRQQTEIKAIKKEKLKDKISELEESKEEWDEAIEILNEEIAKIDKEIEDFDFWIINFGKKGFTTFLVNKAIKSIEGITNSYLKKIESNCQIQLNGYTELKSGDINEKISVEVIEDGFRKGNYLKYSGGEKGRIKLANIFGIWHLMNLTCPTGGFNLLTLDEVFEGLDQRGQIGIIKVLENIGITSLVVTHRSQPIGAENEIFIKKVDRVSSII